MRVVAFVFAGLAFAGHGFGVGSPNSDQLAQLLLAFKPVRGSLAPHSSMHQQPRIGNPQMSHFSTIKTELLDRDLLAKALEDMGVKNLKVAEERNSLPVRGYQGQTQNADIVVQQDNGLDIGFRHNGKKYELVSDLEFWQQKLPQDLFMKRLSQHYSVNQVIQSAKEFGLDIDEVAQKANQDIKIKTSRFR